MDGLSLLGRAAAAGLHISMAGADLVIRGPRSAAALVAEVGRHKAEVMAELRDRDASPAGYGDAYEGDLPPSPTLLTGGYEEEAAPFDWASGEPLPWGDLAAQRWGPAVADPEPGLNVAADWRWEVANWPPDRWSAWHRRAAELELPGADADAIRAAQLLAYEELLGRPGPAEPSGEAPAVAPIGDDAPPGPDAPAADGWGDDPPTIEGFELLDESEWPAFASDRSLTITVEAYRASVEHDRATREAMARQPQPSKRAGRDAGRTPDPEGNHEGSLL